MESEALFLPPYLQSIGYAGFAPFRELASRATTITDKAITEDPAWPPWRGILEYVCCVEHAREMLKNLPTGHALGSADVLPARYHSASLVFFAQATLDNIAVWSSKRLQLSIKGSDCAFHKSKFNAEFKVAAPSVAIAISAHILFITKLENYRQEWIHRLTGGASLYSNKSPSDIDAEIQIMVPINSSIDQYAQTPGAFVKAVARARTNNGGRWLYPIDEFADEFADGLKTFLLVFLAAALDEPRF